MASNAPATATSELRELFPAHADTWRELGDALIRKNNLRTFWEDIPNYQRIVFRQPASTPDLNDLRRRIGDILSPIASIHDKSFEPLRITLKLEALVPVLDELKSSGRCDFPTSTTWIALLSAARLIFTERGFGIEKPTDVPGRIEALGSFCVKLTEFQREVEDCQRAGGLPSYHTDLFYLVKAVKGLADDELLVYLLECDGQRRSGLIRDLDEYLTLPAVPELGKIQWAGTVRVCWYVIFVSEDGKGDSRGIFPYLPQELDRNDCIFRYLPSNLDGGIPVDFNSGRQEDNRIGYLKTQLFVVRYWLRKIVKAMEITIGEKHKYSTVEDGINKVLFKYRFAKGLFCCAELMRYYEDMVRQYRGYYDARKWYGLFTSKVIPIVENEEAFLQDGPMEMKAWCDEVWQAMPSLEDLVDEGETES
ncbi:Hypothetical predicted protein [Lecanosticta acicola]|uniref:Uncharacterized protein n=1 Tax=Lecanosticta acicola TaxID=111012 RepID=A0AAI8Z2Y9_9PEZI|nr:Hypothetical predicted protein [Lecanosticta acicola]